MRSSGARQYPDNDPYGLGGTPRWALGDPIVGEYAYISDGKRHGVVRVRQRRDSSYEGRVMSVWNPITAALIPVKGYPYRSRTCDIPAGAGIWWLIEPANTADWTFDWRKYYGAADSLVGRTYSGDPDGFSRVECSWYFGQVGFRLGSLGYEHPSMVLRRERQPFVESSWRKLDHGGPVVKAHKGSGNPGRKFAVSFTAREPDGWASFYVRVYRRKGLVAAAIYEVELPVGMSTEFTARGVLAKGHRSHLRWCVTGFDASGNKRSDCARLITSRSR
jgi:hypothetical protein